MSEADAKKTHTQPKYTVAPFSGITGCGIFQAGSTFVVAIVPPSLPEALWNEAAKIDAVTRRKKYAAEVERETVRIAAIVCDALNKAGGKQ